MRTTLLFLSILLVGSIQAQDPEKSWMIGSPVSKERSTCIVADDAGNTYSSGYIDEKGLIIKQDPLHQTIWCKTITFPPVVSNVTAISFIDLLGDTIFGCGSIEQNYELAGNFYFKINSQTGAIYWSKYETTSQGYLSAMRYANGKYFLVGGTELSNTLTHAKVMAVSSQTGALIWQTPLLKYMLPIAGGIQRTYITSASEMHNGKLFFTGYHRITNSTGIYPQMPVIIGITESGNLFLEKRIPLPNNGFNTSFQAARIEYDMDENLVLSCYNNGPGSTLNDPNVVLIKLDTLGNVLFSKEYEIVDDGAEQIQAFNETPGSYVFCGPIHTTFVGLYTLKLDKNGEFQKCIGIQKPNTFYGNLAPYNGSGNSDFRNGIHYFPNSEYNLQGSNDVNINNIILDEDLNLIQDCAEMSELPVTITNLSTQLEPLVLTQIPNIFTYQNGIIIEDLELYVSCDSLSLDLQQLSACQAEITATISGFQYPTFYWSDGTVSSSNSLTTSTTDTLIVRVLDIRCCELTDTIVPIAVSTMTMSLQSDTSICLESGATFTIQPVVNNSIGPLNYLWSDNSTTPSLTVTNSGTYWLEISDNCISLRDSIQLSILTLPEINGLNDTLVCEGTFPINLNPTVSAASSILWNDGVNTISRTVIAAGTYTLQATNSCGTTDTSVIISQMNLPEVTLISAIDSCLQNGQTIELVPLLNDVTSVIWSDGTNGNQLPISQTGEYTVYGSNTCGTDSASTSVIIRSFPELDLPSTLDTCFEIGIGFTYTATGNSGTYQWSSGSQTASEWITQEGVYTCTLTNSCGSVSDSMLVSRLAALDLYFPNDSIQVCGQQISANLLEIETNYQYELFSPWTNHLSGPNLTESGWYQIRAFNSCGELWDSIYVDLMNEQALFIPNSFTPNGDEINDKLEISGMNIGITHIQIFNRWGEVIYQLQQKNSPESTSLYLWDGNYKGQACPEGVYQVQLTYANCLGVPTQFTGHVNLIR